MSVPQNALGTSGFVGRRVVAEFDHAFAEFCDTNYCVGVGSGTDAVRYALLAAGVQNGESVITVPNASIATSEAILQAGALPEFVDVHERTYNMDPEKLCKYLETSCDRDQRTGRPISRRTGRTISAIVPVHLYGQPANMDPLLEQAEAYNLIVVEDACQASGAEYFSRISRRWMKVGSMGHAAAFSFSPGVNLGACGEAGAVTTDDPELAQKVRLLRNDGQTNTHYQEAEGSNGCPDGIQAGFVNVQLRQLADWNAKRRRIAEIYKQLFSDVQAIACPFEPLWSRSVYYLFVIRVQQPKKLQEYLLSKGIETGISESIPVHLQNAYRSLGYHEGDFPVAETTGREILSLPIFPNMTEAEQENVAESVMEHLGLEGQRKGCCSCRPGRYAYRISK